eukprot:TRINITY_DN16221_c0_g1_i1.p1 TRINITY_DN16221_c0_g1~~TRINITY_DN16221_c0_g1_i1.p1  ORF type:complete len:528 (-),score=60.00 TRINITY_DN16221_c0_g1_i1:343-1881(-)
MAISVVADMPSTTGQREAGGDAAALACRVDGTRTRQVKKGNKINSQGVRCGTSTDVQSTSTGHVLWEVTEDEIPRCEKCRCTRVFEQGVNALLAARAPTEQTQKIGARCLSTLTSMVRSLGTTWCVQIFGSAANGFGTHGSDLDVTCLQVHSAAEEDGTMLRWRLLPVIRQSGAFVILEEIWGARIPILRLRFEDRLDVDLSCNNIGGVANTRLLRAYSKIDQRIVDLGIAVKLWAKAGQLCGARTGGLSSYTFVLLVLYFMQVSVDVKLPVLPIAAFEGGGMGEDDDRVKCASEGWRCHLRVPDLLARFFSFYSFDFRWGTEVVSIRQGDRLNALDPPFASLRRRAQRRIHIEDPFELERNLNCVLGDHEESLLRAAFTYAHQAILADEFPHGLSPQPGWLPSCSACGASLGKAGELVSGEPAFRSGWNGGSVSTASVAGNFSKSTTVSSMRPSPAVSESEATTAESLQGDVATRSTPTTRWTRPFASQKSSDIAAKVASVCEHSKMIAPD